MYLEGQLPDDIDWEGLGINPDDFFKDIQTHNVQFSNQKINSHIKNQEEQPLNVYELSPPSKNLLNDQIKQGEKKEVHISAMEGSDFKYFAGKSCNSVLSGKKKVGVES